MKGAGFEGKMERSLELLEGLLESEALRLKELENEAKEVDARMEQTDQALGQAGQRAKTQQKLKEEAARLEEAQSGWERAKARVEAMQKEQGEQDRLTRIIREEEGKLEDCRKLMESQRDRQALEEERRSNQTELQEKRNKRSGLLEEKEANAAKAETLKTEGEKKERLENQKRRLKEVQTSLSEWMELEGEAAGGGAGGFHRPGRTAGSNGTRGDPNFGKAGRKPANAGTSFGPKGIAGICPGGRKRRLGSSRAGR